MRRLISRILVVVIPLLVLASASSVIGQTDGEAAAAGQRVVH
jgi:hypothetical protein